MFQEPQHSCTEGVLIPVVHLESLEKEDSVVLPVISQPSTLSQNEFLIFNDGSK